MTTVAVEDTVATSMSSRVFELTDQGWDHPRVVDGAAWGFAELDGIGCVVFSTDPSVQGGALGSSGCDALAEATRAGLAAGLPVVGLWYSGGARLQEGVASLEGMGRMFRAMTAASGRILQVAVVVGPAAGGAAYGPALADVVITAPDARLFVTGPGVIRQVTGEAITAGELGGPAIHGTTSGLVHVEAESEAEAFGVARKTVGLLTAQHIACDQHDAQQPDLRQALPERRQRAYDVHPILHRLLDVGSCVELHRRFAPNVVTMLGRLDGRPVGVVASNPIHLAGCLNADAGDKAARFVRTCDAFGLPLIVVVDVPGYLPGVDQEHSGIVRRGAKLLHAFSEATVPRITVITHKAYGGAYIAMNSRSLGATAVLAWPGARIGVMGAQAAVEVLHRKRLTTLAPAERAIEVARLCEVHEETESLAAAVALGAVDLVIDPADTRAELVRRFALASPARGAHGNIPL